VQFVVEKLLYVCQLQGIYVVYMTLSLCVSIARYMYDIKFLSHMSYTKGSDLQQQLNNY
jgi:hypothetical protein